MAPQAARRRTATAAEAGVTTAAAGFRAGAFRGADFFAGAFLVAEGRAGFPAAGRFVGMKPDPRAQTAVALPP